MLTKGTDTRERAVQQESTVPLERYIATVGIPVLNRPANVEPLLESLTGTLPVDGLTVLPVFIVSPGDRDELDAVKAAGADYEVMTFAAGPGDYARKHNVVFKLSLTPWYFLGADDLRFEQGWLHHAIMEAKRSRACVIGTNDLGNERVMAGVHSTHTLVHADYLDCGTADEDGVLLHEGYGHWFVDDEFVQTAQSRRTFSHARNSHVEHLHPSWGKATDDATYRKGQESLWADQALYNSRKHLWGHR